MQKMTSFTSFFFRCKCTVFFALYCYFFYDVLMTFLIFDKKEVGLVTKKVFFLLPQTALPPATPLVYGLINAVPR